MYEKIKKAKTKIKKILRKKKFDFLYDYAEIDNKKTYKADFYLYEYNTVIEIELCNINNAYFYKNKNNIYSKKKQNFYTLNGVFVFVVSLDDIDNGNLEKILDDFLQKAGRGITINLLDNY